MTQDDLSSAAELTEFSFVSSRRLLAPLITWSRRLWHRFSGTRWSLLWVIQQQSAFNRLAAERIRSLEYASIDNDRATVNLLREVAHAAYAVIHLEEAAERDRVAAGDTLNRIDSEISRLDDLVAQGIAAVEERLRRVDSEIARLEAAVAQGVASVEERLSLADSETKRLNAQHREQITAEIQQIYRAVSNEILGLDVRLHEDISEVQTPLKEAHAKLLEEVEVRLGRLEQRAATRRRVPPLSTAAVTSHGGNGKPPEAPGLDYYLFELKFRGSTADIKERQRVHVERFVGSDLVLDLGCGRGEFLELLAEAGVPARGVDIDADMVDVCAARGLDVVRADVITYLTELEDESLGGVFAAHLVEHLMPEQQRSLIELCCRKLRTGKLLVLETPNPICLAALPAQLTLDPTHQRLLHPELLRFLLASLGFNSVELVFLQSTPDDHRLQLLESDSGGSQSSELPQINALNRNFRLLNDLLFGAQDYAAVGRKAHWSSRLEGVQGAPSAQSPAGG